MLHTSDLLNGLLTIYQDDLTHNLKRVIDRHPEKEARIVEAFSVGQVKSKQWLISHLQGTYQTVFICAGWYGTLASLMFREIGTQIGKVRSFDIDPDATLVADDMNRTQVIKGWQFKATTADIHDMTYPFEYSTLRADGSSVELTDMPDLIINTSCEHIEDFASWYEKIPKGTIVALQTNDFFDHEEHVNCVRSLKEFAEQAPMVGIQYEGTLVLEKYQRFMRIGRV
jgi:hypothetical protein